MKGRLVVTEVLVREDPVWEMRHVLPEVLVREDPVWEIRHVLPELNLENNTVVDVNVNVGDLAHLPCRFPQLSTLHQAFLLLQVSWIRRWDWHILTTGIYTYTSDMRFSVLHTEGSDDWTLQIKYAQIRDNGTYECQMYTGTGVLSQFVNLLVNTPRAAILGPQELHVQEGDTITLICVIQQSKPPFVFWYHGDEMVNYDANRHRLSVVTKVEGTRTHSRLTITDARWEINKSDEWKEKIMATSEDIAAIKEIKLTEETKKQFSQDIK
nr:uncharacterized protein LOC128690677 [Cherax quadricarinatus]